MNIHQLYTDYIITKPMVKPEPVSSGPLQYSGYNFCNSRFNRAKFCIYTNRDIVCCTQAAEYNYQSQIDISRDRGETWTKYEIIAGENISSGEDPSGLCLGFDSSRTPIYGFSRDHNHGACQFVTEDLSTQLGNVSGGSGTQIQDMNWIWNPFISAKGHFYFGNNPRTNVNLDSFSGQSTASSSWIYCRYTGGSNPRIPPYKFYFYYNDKLYESPYSTGENPIGSSISLPKGNTNFITLQGFKGLLIAIYTDSIYWLDSTDTWNLCKINGVDLNIKNINRNYLDLYHTNQVFSAALNVNNRCEFIYTIDGMNYFYMDCTDDLIKDGAPQLNGVPIVTAGLYDITSDNAAYTVYTFVDFAIMNNGNNFVLHTTTKKSSIPDYLTQVEYIRSSTDSSTALQYIDTGISVPDGFTANIVCHIPTQPFQNCILWAEDEMDPVTRLYNSQGLRVLGRSTTLQLGQSTNKTRADNSGLSDIMFSTLKETGYITVIKDTITTTAAQLSATQYTYSSNNLYLFACNSNGTAKDYAVGLTIFLVQIWDANGNLVRYYVPVYNTNTGKYGLYDYVSQEFFGNSGQGDFLGSNE